jgi:O-antigen ligase
VGKVMIANSPVWGNGTGSVAMEYGRIVTSMRDVAPERRALRYGQLHNIYLQILAEWGVIGFSLFVFLLYSLTNPFYRWYRQNSNNTAALAALTLVVLQLSAGMFQCDFFNANVSRPFWLLMGILYMAAANHQQSNTLQQTKKSENDGISSFSSSDFVVS